MNSTSSSSSSSSHIYGPSLFGEPMILRESYDSLPYQRLMMIQIITIISTLLILYIIRCFYYRTIIIRKWLGLLVGANVIIHTVHYVDNIISPVDYHEPKWLYDRRLWCEMEITFAFFFPMSAVLWFGVDLLTTSSIHYLRARRWLYTYGMMSCLTLAHYFVDPPTEYEWGVNLSIAGEGILAIALMVVLYTNQSHNIHREDINITYHPLNKTKAKHSDDETPQ